MSTSKAVSAVDRQTSIEEILNSVTHGVGAVFFLFAMIHLLGIAIHRNDIWRIVSFAVYGISLVVMFTMSALSHGLTGKIKRLFELFDFSAVYLLIAGTYTPVLLIFLRVSVGWPLFWIVWGIAVLGIVFRIFFLGKFNLVGTIFYLLMGWLLVIAFKPLLAAAPREFLFWIVGGGVIYSLGAVIYLLKKIPFHHPIWHLFVLGGSVCHYIGLLLYAV